jgi:hypothetical protein
MSSKPRRIASPLQALSTARADLKALGERIDDPADVDVLGLLRAVLAELRQLRTAIDRKAPAPQRRLSTEDQAALVIVIPAIWKAMKNETFSVRALLHRASQEPELRTALATIDRNPRQIGRLLRRGIGSDVEGYRLSTVGVQRDGLLWTLTAITRKTHLGE